MKKYFKFLLLIVMVTFLFTGCADVVNIYSIDSPYGFWSGLWHGIVLPLSFIGSLLSDNIAIYGVNNTGGWYDFGFVLGLGGLVGSGR